jgi:hypothetical protein
MLSDIVFLYLAKVSVKCGSMEHDLDLGHFLHCSAHAWLMTWLALSIIFGLLKGVWTPY